MLFHWPFPTQFQKIILCETFIKYGATKYKWLEASFDNQIEIKSIA